MLRKILFNVANYILSMLSISVATSWGVIGFDSREDYFFQFDKLTSNLLILPRGLRLEMN